MGMRSTRAFKRKERGVERRKRKSIILIVAEGKNNKSEKNYFESFNLPNSAYRVIVMTPGDTDPEGMFSALCKRCRDDEISPESGDLPFVVLDLDCNEEKASTIRRLSDSNNQVGFIVSNPCFELWYLNHYAYSTREYSSSSAVIAALKEYVPNYEKHNNMYPQLLDKLPTAIKHEQQLENFHAEKLWPSNICNPRTDVGKLVLRMLEKHQ